MISEVPLDTLRRSLHTLHTLFSTSHTVQTFVTSILSNLCPLAPHSLLQKNTPTYIKRNAVNGFLCTSGANTYRKLIILTMGRLLFGDRLGECLSHFCVCCSVCVFCYYCLNGVECGEVAHEFHCLLISLIDGSLLWHSNRTDPRKYFPCVISLVPSFLSTTFNSSEINKHESKSHCFEKRKVKLDKNCWKMSQNVSVMNLHQDKST